MSTTTGIEQEDSLLQESAQKEASLTSSLQELEKELKSVRQELGRVTAERDRMIADAVELRESYNKSDWERKNLRSELKDVKLREQRLLCDNNELEEENIGLQKQVSKLKQSQVEFEAVKHEARRLAEEVDAVKGQTEELIILKGKSRSLESILLLCPYQGGHVSLDSFWRIQGGSLRCDFYIHSYRSEARAKRL